MNINIATFNINKNDGDFPNRIHELSKVIGEHEIDIIAFQEDYNTNEFSSSDILNETLSFNKYSIKTREKLRGDIQSSSNLTLLSKFTAIKQESLYFNNIKNEQRAALFSLLTINSKDILIVNTHLCHLNSNNRVYQLKGILKYIEKLAIQNIIICGDLNSTPDSKEIELLKDNQFCFYNKELTATRGKIIDYIFLKGDIDFNSSKVLLKGYSDHYCLVNNLTI